MNLPVQLSEKPTKKTENKFIASSGNIIQSTNSATTSINKNEDYISTGDHSISSKTLNVFPPNSDENEFQSYSKNSLKPAGVATWKSRVISVVDGDTIFVEDSGKRLKVSLYGIDAPEIGQPLFNEARDFLLKFIGKKVDIQFVTRNSIEDSEMCIIYFGFSVNEEILKQGLAWYADKLSKKVVWKDYELKAQEAKIGIWSNPNPVPPWEYRRNSAKTY